MLGIQDLLMIIGAILVALAVIALVAAMVVKVKKNGDKVHVPNEPEESINESLCCIREELIANFSDEE